MDKKKGIGSVLIIFAILVWTPLGSFIDSIENSVRMPWSSGFSLIELFSFLIAPALFVTGVFLFTSSATNPKYTRIQEAVSKIAIAILLIILLWFAGYGLGISN